MSPLIQALESIFTGLQAQAPRMAAALQPGLTAAEIATQAAPYPFQLPTEVVELYQWRNGSTIANPCELLPMYRFLPLAEALEHYQFTLTTLQEDHPENWQTAFDPCWLPILIEDGNFYLAMGSADVQAHAPVLYRSEYLDVNLEFESLTSMMTAIAACWSTGTYYLAGTEDWPYIDSHDAQELEIWLQYQPDQQSELRALLENRKLDLSPEQLLRAYSNLVYSQHPRAAAIVLQDLQEATQPELRTRLIGLLGDLTDPQALTQVLQLLQTDHETEWGLALFALQAWVQRGAQDERIVNELLTFVQAANARQALPEVVLTDLYLVVELLGELGNQQAVAPLMELLQQPADDFNFEARQQQAAIALGKLGDICAVECLLTIAQTHSDLMLRMAAAQSLTMLGDRRGTEIFQQLTLKQFTGELL